MAETRKTRPVSWLKAARHEFGKFPEGARMVCLTALTIAAEGGKADIAKPLQGVGSGVLEIASYLGAMRFAWSMRRRRARMFGWFMPSKRSRLGE
jgi:phage-related protein